MQDDSFKTQMQESAQLVNKTLESILSAKEIPADLKQMLSYTLEAPAKRIRSVVMLWCCRLVSGQINRNAEISAAALEMVHTYSLVHDDLPAMDDDALRRGLPSCHAAFGEAEAILAGDALLTLAFEILSEEIDDAALAVRLISRLAKDAGAGGMIAGQLADLKAEQGGGNRELLDYIHLNKTAKTFRCGAAMGALCGRANDRQYESLCEYGLKIGLGFQIADDMLDVSSSSKELGKTVGKDARDSKFTSPALMGMDNSRRLADRFADEAVAALKDFGEQADSLRKLARVLQERTK